MGIIMLSVAFLFVAAKVFIYKDDSDKTRRRFLVFAGVILVLVFGLRNGEAEIGSDLNNYYRFFERAISAKSFDTFADSSSFEYGYILLNYALGRVIRWPQFIIFFQATFCIGIALRFIYKHSNDVLMSLLGFMSLGVMQFYLTGLRQSMAMATCLIALEMAERRKFISFALLVVLASSFHQTAIVFAVAYFLVKFPTSKLTFMLDVVFILGLSKAVPIIISIGNDIFDRGYNASYTGNSLGGLINIIVAIIMLIVMYINLSYKKTDAEAVDPQSGNAGKVRPEITKDSINYRFMHVLIFGIGLYAMRFEALILERISLYFTPVMFILMPQIIDYGFDEKSRKALRFVFGAGMLFLVYWRMSGFEYIPIWS